MGNFRDIRKGLDESEEKIKARIRARIEAPNPTLRGKLEQQWLRIAERNKGEKLWRSFPVPRTMDVCASLAKLDNFVTNWGIYTDISDDEINALENSCFCIGDYVQIYDCIKAGITIGDIMEMDNQARAVAPSLFRYV